MPNLLWVILGSVLIGLSLVWIVAWMVRWRTRLPHCPKCRHELTDVVPGEAGVLCSECGTTTVRLSRLHRCPRRWRRALLSVLVMLPASQMVMFSARPDRGWTRWVPSSVLILAAGRFDFGPCLDKGGPGAWMHIALLRRQKFMWEWQRERWFHPLVATAVRDEWAAMQIREVWPESTPPMFVQDPEHGGPLSRSPGARTAPVLWVPPWRGASGAPKATVSVGRATTIKFPRLGSDGWARGEVTLNWSHVSVRPPSDPLLVALGNALDEQGGSFTVSSGAPGAGSFISGAIRLPERSLAPVLRSVRTMDEAITAAPQDARLDGLIPALPTYRLSPDPKDWPDASPTLVFDRAMPTTAPAGWPKEVAFSLGLSLRHEQTTSRLTVGRNYPMDDGIVGFPISFDSASEHLAFRAALARHAAGDPEAWEGWSLVVHGDALGALTTTLAPTYWDGELVSPFRPAR